MFKKIFIKRFAWIIVSSGAFSMSKIHKGTQSQSRGATACKSNPLLSMVDCAFRIAGLSMKLSNLVLINMIVSHSFFRLVIMHEVEECFSAVVAYLLQGSRGFHRLNSTYLGCIEWPFGLLSDFLISSQYAHHHSIVTHTTVSTS